MRLLPRLARALSRATAFCASWFAASSAAADLKPSTVDLEHIAMSAEGAVAPAGGGASALLTLDPELQQQVQMLLRRAMPVRGAAVVLDVRGGKVLAWGEKKHRSGEKSLHFTAKAPAASLFKIITSASLIESARVSPTLNVCWEGGQHGLWRRHLTAGSGPEATCGPFAKALGHSQNAVFAQLATRYLSSNRLMRTALSFGFNKPLPFDVPVDMGTLSIPDAPLEFARAAAGFQGSHLTPLGAAHVAYVIANKGRAADLSIVQAVGDYEAPSRRRNRERVIKESTAWELRRMMEVTVNEGTSFDAFSDERGVSYLGSLRVAGKTGTLQESRSGPTTSWFIGFSPSRNPRVVVSVLLQNGKVWHQKANQVARDILRGYFSARKVRGVKPL